MISIYRIFFSWMPVVMQVIILGLFAYLVLRLVLTIIKIVLDALPFV